MCEPGVKHDRGKPRPGLVMSGFCMSLRAVVDVGTFGANKYTDYGFLTVPNGIGRYTDAMLRHYFAECAGEVSDPESEIMHAAHVAWNALARLELMLRERDASSAAKVD